MNENRNPKRRGRPPKATSPSPVRPDDAKQNDSHLKAEEFGAPQPTGTAPRKRGRPFGSKNKPKSTAPAQQQSKSTQPAQQPKSTAAQSTAAEKPAAPAQSKRRGRPAGSKNKPKAAQPAAQSTASEQPKVAEKSTQPAQQKRSYTTIPVQAYHAGPRRRPAPAPAAPASKSAPAPRPASRAATTRSAASGKLRIIPLGGLMEIGKNITLYEYGDDIIVVDCGMSFPEDDMPGVDVVMPDLSYLFANKHRVRGVFFTHGHEDHIGAVAYMCREMRPPIYATPFTRGLIEGKLEEANLLAGADLVTIHAGERVRAGCFEVEAINVNHSTPDSVAFAITTPIGVVIQTGDFKIDSTPVGGGMIDLGRFAEYGKEGVLALLSDSTNVERAGYTMSERTVGETFNQLFNGCSQRIIVTTFASNVHRIQQIAEAAVRTGRKVAISGRSMEKVMQLAVSLGYIDLPAGTLVDINTIHSYTPSQLVIVTTGSQGETLSALSRMANGTHKQVSIGVNDRVIMSASSIPGNEGSIAKVINDLMKRGADVVYDSLQALHVSGHACQEELKIMLGLIRPKYFMPVHGEYKMLRQHARLAVQMGVDQKNIFISENGRVLELTPTSAKLAGTVPAGQVLLDGTLGNDVANTVLKDRKTMSEDGVIIVALSIDYRSGTVVAGPEVISRGFAVGDDDNLMQKLTSLARDIADEYAYRRDWAALKTVLRARISDQVWKSARRQPIVLPVLLEG